MRVLLIITKYSLTYYKPMGVIIMLPNSLTIEDNGSVSYSDGELFVNSSIYYYNYLKQHTYIGYMNRSYIPDVVTNLINLIRL